MTATASARPPAGAAARGQACPRCGLAAAAAAHARRCPRCLAELPAPAGCSGCGACGRRRGSTSATRPG